MSNNLICHPTKASNYEFPQLTPCWRIYEGKFRGVFWQFEDHFSTFIQVKWSSFPTFYIQIIPKAKRFEMSSKNGDKMGMKMAKKEHKKF